MRIFIKVNNNKLDDIIIEDGYNYNYGVYVDDDGFFANTNFNKITKNTIIQVIQTIITRKNKGLKSYSIDGISGRLMRLLKDEFDIIPSDIIS